MEMYQDGVRVMILPETAKCHRVRECPLEKYIAVAIVNFTRRKTTRKEQEMAKCEYTLKVKVGKSEIKQICKELGGRALTEENLDKYSRTWRRILERVGEQMTKKRAKGGAEE